MARSHADGDRRARVALVGSGTPCGSTIRQALIDFGVPGSRVDLFGASESEEAVISEYDGEARLIQTPDIDSLAASDVVFLCEPGEVVEGVVGLAGRGPSVIDVARTLPAASTATLVHMDVNPQAAVESAGPFAVPHDLTTLLVDLLRPIESAVGCEEVVGFVLRPASDFGEAGVDELRDQTVRLLNFASTTTEVFGRQLAFNVLPQRLVREPETVGSIEGEVGSLLGWSSPRMSLSLAIAPVFFGHSLQLRVKTTRGASAGRLREILDAAGMGSPEERPRLTPLDVSSEKGAFVSEVREDRGGGFWLNAVAGEARARTGELAVRLADAVSGL